MPSTYAGSNTYPLAIEIPSDGDERKASSVNAAFEGLADRTENLRQTRTKYYLLGMGNLMPVSSGHVWSNTSGDYLAAEQLGLIDEDSGSTPWTSGVANGDLIEVEFSSSVQIYSNDSDQASWAIELRSSESATSFTAGTYAAPANGRTRRNMALIAAPSYPLSVDASLSCVLKPGGSTGHLRVVLAAARAGIDQQLSMLNAGGIWRWWRGT